MKKYILLAGLVITLIFQANAQIIAYDYSKIDCKGIFQNLYTTLDQGNVVVLIYEHQCPSCLIGANNIKSVINTYYSSNTYVKVWYLDNGGFSCAAIDTWINNNTLIPGPEFQYSSDFSSPYGSGMPVIVVAGGVAHHTFLISLGPSNVNDIHNAIEAALSSIGIKEISVSLSSFDLYPNPTNSNTITLYYNSLYTQTINAEIFNAEGKIIKPVFEIKAPSGENSKEINVGDLNNGIYFIRLTTNDGFQLKKLFINR